MLSRCSPLFIDRVNTLSMLRLSLSVSLTFTPLTFEIFLSKCNLISLFCCDDAIMVRNQMILCVLLQSTPRADIYICYYSKYPHMCCVTPCMAIYVEFLQKRNKNSFFCGENAVNYGCTAIKWHLRKLQ